MDDESDTKMAGRPKGGTNARRAASSLFSHLAAVLGMTHAEIAEYLDLSIGSVRSYASGARKPPADVMDRLAGLWERVSFRSGSPTDLPPAAQARREALQAIRMRAWKRKAVLDDDDEDEEGED